MSARSEQIVLDFLSRTADAAHGTLRSDERVRFIARLRASIEQQRRAAGAVEPDEVRQVLESYGDPKVLVEQELRRLDEVKAAGAAGSGTAAPDAAQPAAGPAEGRRTAAGPAAMSRGEAGRNAAGNGSAGQGSAGQGSAGQGAVAPDPVTQDSVPDGGVPDGGVPDGGVPDGGVPDGAVPDSQVPIGSTPGAAVARGAVVPIGKTPGGAVARGAVQRRAVAHGAAALGAAAAPAAAAFDPVAFARRFARELLALLLLGLGGLLLPIPLWLIGALLGVTSRVWGRTDKFTGIVGPLIFTLAGVGVIGALNKNPSIPVDLHAYVAAAHADASPLMRIGAALGAVYLAARLARSRANRRISSADWRRDRIGRR